MVLGSSFDSVFGVTLDGYLNSGIWVTLSGFFNYSIGATLDNYFKSGFGADFDRLILGFSVNFILGVSLDGSFIVLSGSGVSTFFVSFSDSSSLLNQVLGLVQL